MKLNRTNHRLTVVPVLLGLFVAGLKAQSIPILNAGFEVDTLPSGQPIPDNTFRVDPSTPTDWDIYDPNAIINGGSNSVGIINPTNSDFYPGGAPEGNQAAIVFLTSSGTGEAGLEQTLTSTLQPETRYTLHVDVGNIASGMGSSFSSDGGTVFYNLAGFPGYRIELLAGGVVIGSDTGAIIGDGQWSTRSIIVDIGPSEPLAGQSLSIRLVNLNLVGTPTEPGIEVNFDNVQLVASPLPDPIEIDSSGGQITITFSGTLQRTTDLEDSESWETLSPQPISPWTFTPDEELEFFRVLLSENEEDSETDGD
ncbi:MAG: hypothetical protein AAGA58_03620 [Verrucomicrobiota bacterium]